ncbi:MAG TPA: hypothetical protein VFI24_04400 [Pyrinomonadaceae bacterium]|nr:hypothetical protein [Pyrinomonadaceae bacterium]
MNQKATRLTHSALSRIIVIAIIACAMVSHAFGQTAADTQIQNQASATYSDGSGGSYSTVSNTVIVTVAKVSGLTITPDGGTDPSVVPGQTGVLFSFRVTNTGNFTDQVRFRAAGASVRLAVGSPAVITRAVIDVNSSGGIDGGDTNIFTNGADVLSANLAQNGFINVLVEASINAGATGGQTVQVFLGDASTGGPSFDNQAADSSANEVRTVSGASVNGLREARGDRSVTVDSDAQLALSLTAPTGPVPLASVITYNWQLCNTGTRTASSITLTNAPGGSNSGVFIIAPVPVGTQFDATQSFPGGVSLLYSTSPLTDNPITTATWVTAQPPLANIRRVAFNIGASLAGGNTCGPVIDMRVLITTTDATNAISEQGDAYARNTLNVQITAQSQLRLTTLLQIGSVLNGPLNQPGAVGPTNTNDDYTNRSVSAGIAGVAPGGVTTAASGAISFTNTLQNTGNANDNFTLTVTSFPAGATVVVNGVTVVNNGVATGSPVPAVAIAFGASANYTVAVTLPGGKVVLTGYDTVIRATSGTTPAATNDTIDRVYTGFLRLVKASSVSNTTGVGGATDAVPGAVITYTITYTNVSSTGGSNNITLTATNIVITEDGAALPNNWATFTDHVVGATDSLGGSITGDAAGSNLLTDTVPSLGPGQSGVFTFRRQIK